MSDPTDSRYPPPGAIIDGKYRVERLLGLGGMGAVAAATHLVRRAPVALKFIDPEQMGKPGWADRFVNEAVVASKIDCEHVVRVFDVGRLPNGAPYLVMELLEGVDLERRLQAEPGGRFEVARAVDYVLQILRALQVAHAAGVVHRDLKPANAVLVERPGEGELVKLLDFGISRLVADDGSEAGRLTQTNVALGTPLYISPEQARDAHNATPRSDLYSVGAMLYELLSGRTPFAAETVNDLLFQLFTREPPPLDALCPGLPPGLGAVVHRALAKAPEARPATAVALALQLAPYADARSARVLERLTRLPSTPGPPSAPSSPRGSKHDEGAPTVRSASTDPIGEPPSAGRLARANAATDLFVPPLATPPSSAAGPVAAESEARPLRRTNLSMTGEANPAAPRRARLPLLAGAAGVALAVFGAFALGARDERGPARAAAGASIEGGEAPRAMGPLANEAAPPLASASALAAGSPGPARAERPVIDVVATPAASGSAGLGRAAGGPVGSGRGKPAAVTTANPYGFGLVK